MSIPLVKGDRVRTGLRGWQGLWYVVQVCFEGCYVCENVGQPIFFFLNPRCWHANYIRNAYRWRHSNKEARQRLATMSIIFMFCLMIVVLTVEFLMKIDGGYPRDAGVFCHSQ